MEVAWSALSLSLQVAGWATALNLVLGIGVGYLLARTRFVGRDLLDTVLTLPMVMPPTVLGYYLLVLLGRNGWLGQWLQDTWGINLIFSLQGAVIAATVVAFPLVFKPARAAFEAIDGQMEEAGRVLRKAFDHGINFFDTARMYTDSEEKIGYALSDVRSQIVIATKSHAKDKKTLEGLGIAIPKPAVAQIAPQYDRVVLLILESMHRD